MYQTNDVYRVGDREETLAEIIPPSKDNACCLVSHSV
jgi:hypothetical protein